MRQTQAKVLIIGSDDVHARIPLMQRLSHDFIVAAAGSNPSSKSVFQGAGFRFFPYSLARGIGPSADILGFASIWRVIAAFQPDIVHAFDTKPGVYACLAARLAGIPVVVGTVTGLGSLYGSDPPGVPIIRAIYERLQRLASRHSDLTIFQNTDDRREFVGRRVVPAAKAALIAGSGVDTHVFDPSRVTAVAREAFRASLGIPRDAVVVTLISRVIRSKGIEPLAEAAENVQRQHPNAYFLLIGAADQDSPDRFTEHELAALRQRVCWPGARSDIPLVLAASDVFVLPSSLREGIPRAMLEAAAMALPIVTTDAPGCNDVVQNGVNGFLTRPGNGAALSEAIARLVRDGDMRLRFGAASRRAALERFDLSIVAAQTRRMYRELLTRKTGFARTNEMNVAVAV
jgi:glycosyltransferase involved in cell wall biosynthesis